MNYICGYVTKKLERSSASWLNGRLPEFSRMSTHPGLGAIAIARAASRISQLGLAKPDIPSRLLDGQGRSLTIGRYLTDRLLKLVNLEKSNEWQSRALWELSTVRAFAESNDRSVASVYKELNEHYASILAQRAASIPERKL